MSTSGLFKVPQIGHEFWSQWGVGSGPDCDLGQLTQPLSFSKMAFLGVGRGVWQGLLHIRIWTEAMRSRAPGVEIWALPAGRVSEASDLTLKFHSDFALVQILISKKCSQVLSPQTIE